MSKKPRIGITMGDPNGIGPEVIVKALCRAEIQELCETVVFGDAEIIQAAADNAGLKTNIKVEDCSNFGKDDLKPGAVDEKAGQASLEYIKSAVSSAMSKEIDAVVTAPISKESTHLAGSIYPGHTDMLQALTSADKAVMMFEGGRFKVMLVTIHTALSKVPGLITKDKVLSTIRITHDSLIDLFKIAEPRPHKT